MELLWLSAPPSRFMGDILDSDYLVWNRPNRYDLSKRLGQISDSSIYHRRFSIHYIPGLSSNHRCHGYVKPSSWNINRNPTSAILL